MSTFTDIRKIAWDKGTVGNPARSVHVPPNGKYPRGCSFNWTAWRISFEHHCGGMEVRPGTVVVFSYGCVMELDKDGAWVPRSFNPDSDLGPRLFMEADDFIFIATE